MLPAFHNLNNVSLADIEALVGARMPESRVLEFKAVDGYVGEKGIREWCKDLSALANTDGGCIVIGVREVDGCAAELLGIEGDVEAAILRLTQAAEAGIRPRVQVRPQRVSLANGKTILLLATPKSRFGPHMSHAGGDRRFYKRTESNVEVMDETEVRRASLASADSEELALTMHRMHAAAFDARPDHYVIILDSFVADNANRFDPGDAAMRHWIRATAGELIWSVSQARIVFDGMVVSAEGNRAEVRVTRTGSVQSHQRIVDPVEIGIGHIGLIEQLAHAVEGVLMVQERLGGSSPLHMCLTMVGCRDRRLTTRCSTSLTIERDTLEFPPLFVEPPMSDALGLLQPWLNQLWNAAGVSRCSLYQDDGSHDWRRFVMRS